MTEALDPGYYEIQIESDIDSFRILPGVRKAGDYSYEPLLYAPATHKDGFVAVFLVQEEREFFVELFLDAKEKKVEPKPYCLGLRRVEQH